MKRLSVFILGLFLFLASLAVANAITVIARDFGQLVARADTIFKGSVVAKTSQWIGEGSTRHIVTFVTFQVEETYKGPAASEQTLRFLGGTVGDDTMDVPDMPHFDPGQKAVLFVVNNGKQFCPLVGIAQGRFHVIADASSGRERVLSDNGSPVLNTADIGKVDKANSPRAQRDARTNAEAITAEQFKSEILGKLADLPR